MENINPENQHPVLANYKEKIADLELQVSVLDKMLAAEIRGRESASNAYKEQVKEALLYWLSLGHNKDNVVYLAEQLDIELTEIKTYTVQVEFQVEVEVEIGEELEAYELSFDVSGNNIEDYSYEVSSIDEN